MQHCSQYFFFDLDGKLLFNVVEPFLKNHYDNMERKDMLKTPYDMDKFPRLQVRRSLILATSKTIADSPDNGGLA